MSGEGGRLAPADAPALREVLQLFWKNRWIVAGATLAAATLVAFWSVRQPKVYEATAVLEYDPMPARPLGGAVAEVVNPVDNYWLTREFYETQNRVLRSRALAERVVASLGLAENRSFLGIEPGDPFPSEETRFRRAVARLRRRLTVEQVPETRLVHITSEDESPERASLIANALADAYIRKTMEDRLGTTIGALDWLNQQLGELKSDLEKSELALHEYRRDNDLLADSMENQQGIIERDIQSLSEALTQTRTKRIEIGARLEQLRSANAADPLSAEANVFDESPDLVALRGALRAKLTQLATESTKYGPQHPSLRALSAEVETLRAQARAEIEGQVARVESQVEEAGRTEAGLRAALEEAKRAGVDLNLREIEYRRLARDSESATKLYGVVLQRTAETNLSRLQEVAQARVLDRALVPARPVGPRTALHVAAGSLFGLVFGLGLAIALRQLDRTVRSVEDIEAHQVTVLGVLPSIVGAAEGRGGATAAVASRQRDLSVHLSPQGSPAECARTLRTNLAFMSGDRALGALVVTSANPQEGKTTVTSSIAISFAQSGKRVLLVDSDMRRPRIHRTFQLPSDRGLTTILAGAHTLEEAAAPTEVPGLSVLVCGPIPPNPAELLHTRRFNEFLEGARERFDVVVFDSPPLGPVTDAAILAAQLDGVLVVVKLRRTARDALAGALKQLRSVGANLLGVVLNDVDMSEHAYGYGGTYYYYRDEDAAHAPRGGLGAEAAE